MDVQLVVLIVLVVAVLIVSARLNARWLNRPGADYQRVFSAGAAGLLFFVSGLIGWDLSHSRGWFGGAKWVDGPVWWQIGLGFGLLLPIFLARRVSPRVAGK
jgi:hypothetical protein